MATTKLAASASWLLRHAIAVLHLPDVLLQAVNNSLALFGRNCREQLIQLGGLGRSRFGLRLFNRVLRLGVLWLLGWLGGLAELVNFLGKLSGKFRLGKIGLKLTRRFQGIGRVLGTNLVVAGCNLFPVFRVRESALDNNVAFGPGLRQLGRRLIEPDLVRAKTVRLFGLRWVQALVCCVTVVWQRRFLRCCGFSFAHSNPLPKKYTGPGVPKLDPPADENVLSELLS